MKIRDQIPENMLPSNFWLSYDDPRSLYLISKNRVLWAKTDRVGLKLVFCKAISIILKYLSKPTKKILPVFRALTLSAVRLSLHHLSHPPVILVGVSTVQLCSLAVCWAVWVGCSQEQIYGCHKRVHEVTLARVVTRVPAQLSVCPDVWMEKARCESDYRRFPWESIRAFDAHLD
jgi:hypothetical protein